MTIDTPFIKNSLGLSSADLLKVVSYILDFNETDILNLDLIGVDSISSVPELYVSLIWYFSNKLYKEDKLLKSYYDNEYKELNYIVGTVDISKSVNWGSIGRGYLYQNISKLSYDIPVNNVLGFCLSCYVNINPVTSEYNNLLKSFYKTIFNRDMPVFINIDKLELLKYIEIAYDYTDGDYSYGFSDYKNVLMICKLFMQSLYYCLINYDFDGFSDARFIEYIMENFTRTAIRKVMRNIAREHGIVNKYQIRNSDLVVLKNTISSDLKLDILLKFANGVDLPDIIIDVKTNKEIIGKNKYNKEVNVN